MRTRTRRRRRNLANVAIATLLTGTLLYAARHEDHPTTKHPAPPQTTATWASATVQPSPQIDTATLSWSDYLGTRLPTSATDGPLDASGGLARRFTRTPRGALLAAVNIVIRANWKGGPRVFEPTIEHQVIGPDTKALLMATRYAYDYYRGNTAVASGTPDRSGGGVEEKSSGVAEEAPLAQLRIEAYRWQGYTPLEASLDMVSAKPGDDDLIYRAAIHIQLRWQDGDWRVLAPAGGTWSSAAIRIESLDGYDRFTGGR